MPAPSLRRFIGADGYDPAELRTNQVRFTVLISGNDGEEMFGLNCA